jgi:thiol-disulfide isomerase/thioredoxin
VAPPSLDVIDGSVTPVFSVVQFGIVTGPDGLIYVLAATTPGGPPDNVLAFDREGRFVRSGPISENEAVFADTRGRIYTISREDALSRTGEPERATFPEFDLALLGREGQTSLESHRGKVVVVNFWASWCGPCRREMPLLDAFARQLDPDQAIVIGLNEDLDPEDALAFIDEIGGVSYDHGQGGGRLRRSYNYRGLPYTVVLDRDLRVIRGFYGFGSSIDPIKEAVERELAAGG